MAVFTKPKEFLTTSEYRAALEELPFSCDEHGYMEALERFEVLLRAFQQAWREYGEMRANWEDEEAEDIKTARELADALYDEAKNTGDVIRATYGVDGAALKRDADLLRDKRQAGVM